jgi:hypothetical protein
MEIVVELLFNTLDTTEVVTPISLASDEKVIDVLFAMATPSFNDDPAC